MKKKICVILIAVFVAVLGASTYFIIDHYKESNKQAELYSELADLVNAAAQTDAATEPAEQIPYSEEKMLLPELAELYQQNGDLVGWISIADTNINYPVMQSVNEPNFYLKYGFDKDYSDYGCPYVQEDCDVQEPSDNLVIYGHHMSNGSMFAHLEKFKNKDFWSEHRIITFNTLTDKQEYEIVAVFRTVVYTDSPEAFKFYRFIDAESANEFDDFIAKCKELSFYDTGVTAEYGDKLITLSTCEYSRNNSRLVVVAKHITEDGGADAAKPHAEATAEANALIKRLCANYDNGNCLALDNGEPCVCVQSISYSLLCKYFRSAVLPAEPLLEAAILGTRFEKCVSCGAPIIKKGNRKKYCEKCAQRAYKAQQAEYARRKQAESKNRR